MSTNAEMRSVGLLLAEMIGRPGGFFFYLCILGKRYNSGVFGDSKYRKSLTFLVISPLWTIKSSWFFILTLWSEVGLWSSLL